MAKYVVSEDDLYKLQWDALYESTENNPYLPYKTSASLNKSLLTNNKRIIKAINEILEIAETANQSVVDFASRFNSIIGDEMADPTLLENLRSIDENFFKAIVKVHHEIESGAGSSEVIEALQNADIEIENAIDTLNQKIAQIESCIEDYEEICTIDTSLQSILLTHTPKNKDCIDLYINEFH